MKHEMKFKITWAPTAGQNYKFEMIDVWFLELVEPLPDLELDKTSFLSRGSAEWHANRFAKEHGGEAEFEFVDLDGNPLDLSLFI